MKDQTDKLRRRESATDSATNGEDRFVYWMLLIFALIQSAVFIWAATTGAPLVAIQAFLLIMFAGWVYNAEYSARRAWWWFDVSQQQRRRELATHRETIAAYNSPATGQGESRE